MPTVLVSDTNIWIDFERAGQLQLLFRLPYQFSTTDFVASELGDEVRVQLVGFGMSIISLDSSGIRDLHQLKMELRNPSLADLSCYYVARRDGSTLLSGDRKLREAAQAANIEVFGTLWLLDRLVEHSVLTAHDAAIALEAMIQANGRLPAHECSNRLKAWRQKQE